MPSRKDNSLSYETGEPLDVDESRANQAEVKSINEMNCSQNGDNEGNSPSYNGKSGPIQEKDSDQIPQFEIPPTIPPSTIHYDDYVTDDHNFTDDSSVTTYESYSSVSRNDQALLNYTFATSQQSLHGNSNLSSSCSSASYTSLAESAGSSNTSDGSTTYYKSRQKKEEFRRSFFAFAHDSDNSRGAWPTARIQQRTLELKPSFFLAKRHYSDLIPVKSFNEMNCSHNGDNEGNSPSYNGKSGPIQEKDSDQIPQFEIPPTIPPSTIHYDDYVTDDHNFTDDSSVTTYESYSSVSRNDQALLNYTFATSQQSLHGNSNLSSSCSSASYTSLAESAGSSNTSDGSTTYYESRRKKEEFRRSFFAFAHDSDNSRGAWPTARRQRKQQQQQQPRSSTVEHDSITTPLFIEDSLESLPFTYTLSMKSDDDESSEL